MNWGKTMPGFTTRPEIRGTFGVAASTHWIASSVAMGILERGGNAFDAVVAAGFTLQVAEPHLNGPGGDVPIIFQSASEDKVRVLCGQGPAPGGATIDHYRGLDLALVPGTGQLAAVVPSAFGAWMTLARDHGTMTVSDLLAPAIFYARNGCPLVPRICETIKSVQDLFQTHWTSSAALYLPGGAVPKPGTLLKNPVLADTYERIATEASTAGSRQAQFDAAIAIFYEGFVAEQIAAFAKTPVFDVSGRHNSGLLTADDLAAWRPAYEDPVSLDYHDARVFKCGPWSQGPVFLQQLALLAGFDLAAMDTAGAEFVHVVTECAKLAFADREAYYGDPDFVDVPLTVLLSDDYNAARRALVGERANLEQRPGTIKGYAGRLPAEITVDDAFLAHGVGEPTTAAYPASAVRAGQGDTCHIDVIDTFGNMVAATPSGGWLQSNPVIPDLGFALGSRAQMFWLEEGLPASLAPGKRPRTTLTPSLAWRDGKPYMAFGTPGGDSQDQWSVIFLLRHLHHGLNLQEAIDAPYFHNKHFRSSFYPRGAEPGVLEVEDRFGEAVIGELKSRGHKVSVNESWSISRLSAAARQSDGVLKAAANPRGMQGYAVGR
jgi:gamma-glutamyltranspeptidase/glutathione hydrolase